MRDNPAAEMARRVAQRSPLLQMAYANFLSFALQGRWLLLGKMHPLRLGAATLASHLLALSTSIAIGGIFDVNLRH